MAASRGGSRGQSVLEFLFMLPLIIGFTVIVVRVNTAIQVSIVDQQYARQQTLHLAFNSAYYPRMDLRVGLLDQRGYNQMILGVSDNTPPSRAESFHPKATTQLVTRPLSGLKGSNERGEDHQERGIVRVRDTVTLCTQTNVVNSAAGRRTPIVLFNSDLKPLGRNILNEDSTFELCGGPTTYYE